MAQIKRPPWSRALSSTLALVLMNFVIFPSQSWAQLSFIERIKELFSPSSDLGGAPTGRRRGGAVRDPDLCRPPSGQPTHPLTALVPNTNEPVKTSDKHPAFWFYVPYQLTDNPQKTILRFVLQDEQYNDIYETSFTVPGPTSPGIISLRLLSQKAELETGKTYRWYFLIYCDDPKGITEPAFVEGVIKRETLGANLRDEFDQADTQSWLLARAEAGLWYDILATLADVRRMNPDNSDFAMTWEQVLQGIDLTEIYDAPIIGRYHVLPDNFPPEN